MNQPKRKYKNAGTQTAQGRTEYMSFWQAEPQVLFTVTGIALALGINRNAVVQIPVKRYLIDKRAYYRKGDIEAWLNTEIAMPDGLLRQLQIKQESAEKRMRKHRSRIYTPEKQSAEESKASKAASKENLRRIKELADSCWFNSLDGTKSR
jgi:hypothetical protein